MSSENIEIIRQNSNGYDTFYPVNSADNVKDGSYTLLWNLQALANEYISLDGVYWEDITRSKLLSQADSFKSYILASEHPYICNCESFYCLFLVKNGNSVSSPATIQMYYSFDIGENWYKYAFSLPNEAESNTFYILGAEAILTATGYDIIFIGSCGLTSSYTVYTYRVRFPDHHISNVSPIATLFNDARPYYSDNTRLYKTYRGVYMIDSNGQLKYCSASYNANSNRTILYNNFSWTIVLNNLNTYGVPKYMLCDKIIDTIYIYLENGDFLFYAPYDLSQSTLIESPIDADIVDITYAFNRAFMFADDNSLYYYCYDNTNNFSLNKIELPDGHIWKYVFGNDYKLYIVDDNGIIAYIQSVDDEWHYSNQSKPSAIIQWQTLNSFDIQNAQFCANKKNDAIMAIFININNRASIVRTYCGNYK